MTKYLTSALFAAAMALGTAPATAATTLSFSDACDGPCTYYSVISQSYGDIEGILDVSYRSVAGQGSDVTVGDAYFWNVGYADLTGVVFGANGSTLEVAFRLLDPTKTITFNSVSFAAYSGVTATTVFALHDLNLAQQSVASLDTGSVSVPNEGHAVWAPNFASLNGFRFHFGADAYNVAIDNLTFTIGEAAAVPVVPEPATWLSMLLGFGLVGVVARRAKRKSIALA